MTYQMIGLWKNEEEIVTKALEALTNLTENPSEKSLAEGVLNKIRGLNENQNNESK